MAVREHAAGLPVGDHRQPQRLRAQPGGRLRAVQPDVRAEYEDRSPRRREQRGDGGNVFRVRRQGGRAAGPRRAAGPPSLAVDRLQREVAEHRPPVRGQRQPERLVDRPGHPAGRVLGPRPLGDRCEQRHVVQLLQRALAPQVVGCPAAQHDQRRAVEPGAGHRADAVGDPGPGGDHGEPGRPGQPRGRLGREHGGLLVPHVHQPQRRVGLDRAVVEREHVPAGQGEHRRHAVPLRDRHGVRAGVSRERGHPADAIAVGEVCGRSHSKQRFVQDERFSIPRAKGRAPVSD